MRGSHVKHDDLLCRCQGIDGRIPCGSLASEEDGLCDGCRCVHGCCSDHGYPALELAIENADRYWTEVMAANRTAVACRSGVIATDTGT